MNLTVKASLILAGCVTLLSIVLQVSGVNSDFMLGQRLFLAGAVAINVGVVMWALGQTAATDGYGSQVLKAGAIGILGGIFVVLSSWALLTLVFPDALREVGDAAIAWMDTQNLDPATYDKQIAAIEATTPMSQSIAGGIGTVATSLLAGLIVAIFKRRK